MAWTLGDSLFNIVRIPAFDPGNEALPQLVQKIHGTSAWLILGLAGLHASAALMHHYVWHDGVLAQLLPRL